VDQAAREIEGGFESLRNAIGDSQAVSPFFRNPGLLRQKSVEQYLDAHGDMTWSADFLADDWTRINNSEVARRAISRIEARGRGILLLHDIHARTVLALPEILNELKSRGYKIVHVVPAAADRPKTATSAEQWVARPETEQHTRPSQMRPLRRSPKRGLRTLHDVRFRG
jgi:peptidoglycan/xylan/chitin deacetylase (PgdA/CDA1 family)